MKLQRGPLPGDSARNDNLRARRYVAKYTLNPAITHGIAHAMVEALGLHNVRERRPFEPERVSMPGTVTRRCTSTAESVRK